MANIFDMFGEDKKLIDKSEELIDDLFSRGYFDRDRLFRKLVEETGEYAEAIEYNNGATRKLEKFGGKETPEEKLREEIADIFMVTLALARCDKISIRDLLEIINKKLGRRKTENDSLSKEG